jgi:hypothetical protein
MEKIYLYTLCVYIGKHNIEDLLKVLNLLINSLTKTNNYDYILRTNSKTERAPTWEKIDIIKELILTNKYDYIFWMDTDSIFTNFSIKIENIINNVGSNYNFIFSGDTNIINAGHFIFKSCEWSLKELDKIWTIFPANYGMSGDNAAFSVWLSGGNGSMTHEEQKNTMKWLTKDIQIYMKNM